MGLNYNRKILKRNNIISFTKLVMKNKYKKRSLGAGSSKK